MHPLRRGCLAADAAPARSRYLPRLWLNGRSADCSRYDRGHEAVSMKRSRADAVASFALRGASIIGVPAHGASGVVSLAWLPGAGHTAWVNHMPPAVRVECEEIIGALRPRCSVEI